MTGIQRSRLNATNMKFRITKIGLQNEFGTEKRNFKHITIILIFIVKQVDNMKNFKATKYSFSVYQY